MSPQQRIAHRNAGSSQGEEIKLSSLSFLPQMPAIRAAAECPEQLLAVSEGSVSRGSGSADAIWGEEHPPARFNVTTAAQSAVPSFSVWCRASPAERQWQQQSVSYLLSLPLIPSLAAGPGICPWNVDLGSAVPTHRASLLFQPIENLFLSSQASFAC